MGELILAAPVAGLASKNRIVADDVAMLREEVFRDGVVTRGEAEALFALDASCGDKCPEWAGFFIEAVVDYIVHQEKPQGYVSEENAQWLIRAIGRDGVVDSAVELEMLVRVLEAATSSPQTLEIYALDQVRIAVLDGSGPLVDGHHTKSLPGEAVAPPPTGSTTKASTPRAIATATEAGRRRAER